MDSGFNDFFRQIPQGFILMFCGSGILLVLVIVYSIYARRKRVTTTPPAAAETAAPVYAASVADLPDLDDLASADLKAKPAVAKSHPSGAHTVALSGGENVEVVEVLTVLRDVGEGGLIIQIGGEAYRNPPAYADADFKRRLHNTLRDLNGAISSSTEQAVPAEPAVSIPEAVDEPAPDVEPPTASSAVPPPQATRLDPTVPAPGDLPKFRMPDGPVVKPKRGEKLVKEPIPEINIAGSIEAFLQHKLVRTPQYSTRSIHVIPTSHGGVQIEVDGTYYESVAEVADDGVRQFLAATIEEWQARQ